MNGKIAVIRRNGFGDLVCTIPLIRYLHQQYPDSEITLFVDESNSALAKYIPHLKEVIVIPRGNKYLNLLLLAVKYYRHFEQAYSAKTSPMKMMNLFLYCLQAKKRYAYIDKSWHSCLINYPRKHQNKRGQHQALKVLHLADASFKSVPKELFPRLVVREAKKLTTPLMVISASTTGEVSRLPSHDYAAIINTLANDFSFEVRITNLPQDLARAQELESLINTKVSIQPPVDFDGFISLINMCDLVFAGDGGIAHISSALGKYGVFLYGGLSHNSWDPLGHHIDAYFDENHVKNISKELIIKSLHAKLKSLVE